MGSHSIAGRLCPKRQRRGLFQSQHDPPHRPVVFDPGDQFDLSRPAAAPSRRTRVMKSPIQLLPVFFAGVSCLFAARWASSV